MFHAPDKHERRARVFSVPAMLLLLALIPATACQRERTLEHGLALVIDSPADPGLIFPPTISSTLGFQIADLILERLAEPDSTLDIASDATYRPRLADAWSWAPDSLSIAFILSAGARWHDGVPVTANDVRFTFDVYRDPAVASHAAPLLANVDSVTVRDGRTAVFWFRRRHPEQFYDATYHMRILPEHILGGVPRHELSTSTFARAPVGSGPLRFDRWVPQRVIELTANADYDRGPARVDRVLFVITPDPAAALARLRSGGSHFLPRLRPGDIQAVAKDEELRLVRWPSLSSGLVLFNLRDPRDLARPHPVLAEHGVRQAISTAMDRQAIVTSVFGVMATPARGPLPVALLDGDSLPLSPHDPERARFLLDSLGWSVHTRASVRQRNGRNLGFTLLVPSGGSAATRVAVLAQQQLARVGVAMEIEYLEHVTTIQRLAERRFDAALVALDWTPSAASARQLWGAEGMHPGGSNFSGYRSSTYDALMDSASFAADGGRMRAYRKRAWEALLADAPAIWLYDLSNVGAAHRCLHPAGLRADGWWFDLASWSLAWPSCAVPDAAGRTMP